MRTYTAKELISKYRGKYINTHPTYDYTTRQWRYEVRGVSDHIRENYNPPEEEIAL